MKKITREDVKVLAVIAVLFVLAVATCWAFLSPYEFESETTVGYIGAPPSDLTLFPEETPTACDLLYSPKPADGNQEVSTNIDFYVQAKTTFGNTPACGDHVKIQVLRLFSKVPSRHLIHSWQYTQVIK
jgi:hypothetical protein